MNVRSFAKINLGLEVLRRRPDGYHDIRTLFQWTSLHDTIEFRDLDAPEVRLRGDDPSIPWDETNLVARAARLLRSRADIRAGVEISVAKRIPAGRGLAGGSSNAALTLWGLDAFWRLGLPRTDLEDMARELGADVAYFLTGGLCLGEGRGDVITPLPDLPNFPVVLVLPGFPVPTPRIYQNLDPAALTSEGEDSRMTQFLRARNPGVLMNALEETIFRLYPQLAEFKSLFRDQGAVLSLVTGSGSGVYGLFEERGPAERCLAALKGRGEAVLVETLTRAQGWDAIEVGVSPSGKAAGFGPAIRGFESSRPSGYKRAKREA
jgi:4-diphosphocytidyl-2-C-methyl-D-erythritol kinase